MSSESDIFYSLTDVKRLTELLDGIDTCFIATTTDFNNDKLVEGISMLFLFISRITFNMNRLILRVLLCCVEWVHLNRVRFYLVVLEWGNVFWLSVLFQYFSFIKIHTISHFGVKSTFANVDWYMISYDISVSLSNRVDVPSYFYNRT